MWKDLKNKTKAGDLSTSEEEIRYKTLTIGVQRREWIKGTLLRQN